MHITAKGKVIMIVFRDIVEKGILQLLLPTRLHERLPAAKADNKEFLDIVSSFW